MYSNFFFGNLPQHQSRKHSNTTTMVFRLRFGLRLNFLITRAENE